MENAADRVAGIGGSGAMIHCRQATQEDEPFLRGLLIATLTEELAAWAWPEAIREQLLEMQCRVRRQGIAANYPDAEISVVSADAEPVGWIVVMRSAEELYIVDIAVLPGRRGEGIGTAALRGTLEEADRNGLPARLNVNIGNRANALYERLGFRRTGGTDLQDFMAREPDRL
jgi:ribosomal protein S18 acetylase RimI-like enzyme